MTLLLLLQTTSGGGVDTIVVDEPLAGERLLVGETVPIHVSVAPGVSGLFDVLLSLDGGSTFPITLQSGEAEIDLGWTILAAHITATAVIRVRDSADAMTFGDSDEFIIATTTAVSGDIADVQTTVDEILDLLTVTDLWVKRIAVTTTGVLSGAGTNTEVFTVSALGITGTATVDDSGNRTNMVWS
jgi:hypothetical protein